MRHRFVGAPVLTMIRATIAGEKQHVVAALE